jgi:hypothetical protein
MRKEKDPNLDPGGPKTPGSPTLLGVNLTQLEQFLLQLCRIQVLLLGQLVQDELEPGCLALPHEHVGVTDGGASVQQPPHHALHTEYKDKNNKWGV